MDWVSTSLQCKDTSQSNLHIDFAGGFKGIHSICQDFIEGTPPDIAAFCSWLTPLLSSHDIKRTSADGACSLSKGMHWMINKQTTEVGDLTSGQGVGRTSVSVERVGERESVERVGERVYRSRGC